jgi:hypothetical protein
MREDLPPPELQDLYPVPADGPVPHRWARAVNRACTIWLLDRGLLEPEGEQPLFAPLAATRPAAEASPASVPTTTVSEEEAR